MPAVLIGRSQTAAKPAMPRTPALDPGALIRLPITSELALRGATEVRVPDLRRAQGERPGVLGWFIIGAGSAPRISSRLAMLALTRGVRSTSPGASKVAWLALSVAAEPPGWFSRLRRGRRGACAYPRVRWPSPGR